MPGGHPAVGGLRGGLCTEELYAVGCVTVNGESLASSHFPAHHESRELFFGGSFGEDLNSFQAPLAPCTRP